MLLLLPMNRVQITVPVGVSIISPGCTVNDNAPVEVVFGLVCTDSITANLYQSTATKFVLVRFSCAAASAAQEGHSKGCRCSAKRPW